METSQLIELLASHEWSIATAESLTGGMVCSALCDVPGASAVVKGGVVAYSNEIKRSVLDVSRSRLNEFGAVDPVVCENMAQGVIDLMGVDVAIATTGVAGPDGEDGHPVGEVHIGVMTPLGFVHRELHLEGQRNQIRQLTTHAALELAYTFIVSGDQQQG